MYVFYEASTVVGLYLTYSKSLAVIHLHSCVNLPLHPPPQLILWSQDNLILHTLCTAPSLRWWSGSPGGNTMRVKWEPGWAPSRAWWYMQMAGQRLGTTGLSRIQPKPWHWYMQVPVWDADSSASTPYSHHPPRVLPLEPHPSLSCHLH